jgi:transcriptional regulator with XRE-family HTH domain
VEATLGVVLDMGFQERLISLRKRMGLTQQALADRVGVHVIQIHRYESAASQPSLEVIKKLAVALSVTTDALLFDDSERGPDEELRLKFEAVSAMPDDDKHVIASLIDAYIKKHQIESVLAR